MNEPLSRIIASELQARPEQVISAIRLLDEGNTVPFISRYRKEVTGGLDDIQLRQLESRLGYLRELEDRRQTILKSIEDQGKLTDQLAGAINATLSKTELEDLYLPYKPKRRTRGQIAIEAGLEPWQSVYGRIHNKTLNTPRWPMLMPIKASLILKPRWMVLAIF